MPYSDNLGRKVTSGLVWAYGEKLTSQGISFLVSVILARLIEPEKYGIVAIVMVFISIADVFVSGGFGSALVQKKEANSNDYNTAFSLGLMMSAVMYIILFCSSPAIAKFYNMPELKNLIRVMGIKLPIASINSVQHASIQRNMEFKKFFVATLVGTVISAAVGIYMAFHDYGAWAIIAQYLTNSIIDTMALFIIGKWMPHFMIVLSKAREIISFGWKVMMQNLLSSAMSNIQSLLIGRFFSASDLAYYNNGAKIPQTVLVNIFDTISKVFFPALSQIKDEEERTKKVIRKAIKYSIFVFSPILLGMCAVAKSIILIIYTDKWSKCTIFLQIYCLRLLARPLMTILQQALMAKGRSDMTLKIEMVLNVALFSTLLIAIFGFYSVEMVAWGTLFAVGIGILIYVFVGNRIFHYKFKEQVIDIVPSLVSSIIMVVAIYLVEPLFSNLIIGLICRIIIGIIIYLMLSIILNQEVVREIYRYLNLYINLK